MSECDDSNQTPPWVRLKDEWSRFAYAMGYGEIDVDDVTAPITVGQRGWFSALARAVGVCRGTAYRWLATKELRAEVREWRKIAASENELNRARMELREAQALGRIIDTVDLSELDVRSLAKLDYWIAGSAGRGPGRPRKLRLKKMTKPRKPCATTEQTVPETDWVGRERLQIPNFRQRILRAFGSVAAFYRHIRAKHPGLISSRRTIDNYMRWGVPACRRDLCTKLRRVLAGRERCLRTDCAQRVPRTPGDGRHRCVSKEVSCDG